MRLKCCDQTQASAKQLLCEAKPFKTWRRNEAYLNLMPTQQRKLNMFKLQAFISEGAAMPCQKARYDWVDHSLVNVVPNGREDEHECGTEQRPTSGVGAFLYPFTYIERSIAQQVVDQRTIVVERVRQVDKCVGILVPS